MGFEQPNQENSQSKQNSVNDEIGELFVCLQILWIQTADKRAFEEVNAKSDKILEKLRWLVGVLSFEDRCWKELGCDLITTLALCYNIRTR